MWGRGIRGFSTAVAEEEPITPHVQVNYTKLLINGQFVDSASGKTFPTLDPRTGEVIAYVAEGDEEDINRAVAAARKAFDEGPWPKISPYERSQILYRFADLVEKHNDEIAALETWDNGKPYQQAAFSEVPLLARLFRNPSRRCCLLRAPPAFHFCVDQHRLMDSGPDFDANAPLAASDFRSGHQNPHENRCLCFVFFLLPRCRLLRLFSTDASLTSSQEKFQQPKPPVCCLISGRKPTSWADKIHGLTVPADGPHHVQVLHEPIGVAGQIIPWNFPVIMYAWKVGPALACGNTIVLKTAEQTPLSALYISKLFLEAGLPPGVLNVISGYGPTAGAPLASHMDVDKLAFTGSTETGKIVLELAARSNLKPVTLELGGKSPFIICEDADIDRAVELAHFALFFNQGQCCCAGSRTFVHERVYDEFVEKAKARALKRVVGDPFRKGVEQGPQIDLEQFEKIMKYIKSGVESGATLEVGGDRIGNKGFYIQPTVFSDVKDGMKIATDEIFGPVQTILKFKDLDEVIKRANATHYGLAAGVFTKNIDTANTLTRALRVGTVWVNCYDVFDAAIPFGGYKMSGHGREKGIYSLNNYLQVKAVVTPLKNPAWL
ncbi:hypothetical protein ACLOJK_031152 [Asimina triloba]